MAFSDPGHCDRVSSTNFCAAFWTPATGTTRRSALRWPRRAPFPAHFRRQNAGSNPTKREPMTTTTILCSPCEASSSLLRTVAAVAAAFWSTWRRTARCCWCRPPRGRRTRTSGHCWTRYATTTDRRSRPKSIGSFVRSEQDVSLPFINFFLTKNYPNNAQP